MSIYRLSTSTRLVGIAALVAVLIAARVPSLSAQAPRTITLAAALATAMRSSPDLSTARLRADSAAAELSVARALPNPSLQTIPGVPSQYGVVVPLDVGPQRWARVRAQRLGHDASIGDVADDERLVRFAVRQAYVDAQLAEALRRISADEREAVHQLLVADSARLRAGDLSERDLVRTQLELARMDATVQRAGSGVRATRLALQLVIGVERPDTALAVADSLAAPERVLVTAESTSRPAEERADVRAAASRVQASRASLALARAMLLPTPQIGVIEQPAAPFASGRHEALALSVTLPLFDRFDGARARALSSVRAAEVDAARRQVHVAAEVAETADSVRAAGELLARYRGGLLAQADSALAMTRYAYAAGAAPLSELLDAVRTHVATRAEYVGTVHDYWVSLYAYLRATGTELDLP